MVEIVKMEDWEYFNRIVVPKLGKSSWLFDPDLLGDGSNIAMHIPCCSRLLPTGRPCHNGPLTGNEILTGDCGEHDADPS